VWGHLGKRTPIGKEGSREGNPTQASGEHFAVEGTFCVRGMAMDFSPALKRSKEMTSIIFFLDSAV